MTARISLVWAVMTIAVFACAVPVQVMTVSPEPTAVMTTKSKPVMTASNVVMTVQVTAYQFLYIRDEPMGLRIGSLRHGESVTLSGVCRDGWAQIFWKQSVAWVKASYLSENKCQEQKVTGS